MRRFLLSLLAASSAALLSACGQGGAAFNQNGTSKIDRVVFTTPNGGTTGIFKVVPGGQILITAVGVKGTQNVINTNDNRFTFNVAYAPAGALYQAQPDGVTQASCPAPPAAPQPVLPTLTPAPQSPDTIALVAPVAAAPYCLTLNATHVTDQVVGSVNVFVTSSF